MTLLIFIRHLFLPRVAILLLLLLLLHHQVRHVSSSPNYSSSSSRQVLMGYLTGSLRRPGDSVYSRPGQAISGAISYAVEQINKYHPLVNNYTLAFVVAETYGDESESIRNTAKLWSRGNVSVYIGPQETCVHEARMAASFNLPMISYFCTHAETSDKNIFPTFARTRPPDTQISKSVVSLLVRFNWRKVALIYSKHQTATRDYEAIAKTIRQTLEANGISVRFQDKWTTAYFHGLDLQNPFDEIVDNSHTQARIYVIVGDYDEHLGLLLSLSQKKLLATGHYFVVGVDLGVYDPKQKYFYSGILKGTSEEIRTRDTSEVKQAFQSYMGILSSPPSGFEKFSLQVNKYLQQPPFEFTNPIQSDFNAQRRIPLEAAYLYDAVALYARAVNECLINGQDFRDGRVIFSHIRSRPYFSAMGFMVWMDENGDAEGNYTLVARKKRETDGLHPIGTFLLPANSSQVPMLNIVDEIEWPSFRPPADEPFCGFHEEKCKAPPIKWIVSLVAIVTFVLVIIAFALYKTWRYEQELDSLLWKIDLKDVSITDTGPTSKTKSRHSSTMSLNSTCDLMEFRYCNVYTDIGLYKGRLVALKKLYKKSIEITRKIKKELNLMKDIRHDNLNPFLGVSIEAPLICIITEYCSRGSLQVVLQNENFHLDNIFAASMIGDIIRGMIYLHDSPVVSHGNLKSSNCLVDCRWVIKICDYGLCELKLGTSDFCDGSPPNNKKNIDTHCERLLWKSPEILRDQTGTFSRGTQKGDVYSFGLILYEILGRSGPWGKTGFSASEIVRRVITRTFGIEPFRPSLELLAAKRQTCELSDYIYDCIVQSMVSCWAENPEERPDFKNLRGRLRPIRKGMKNNILDNMLELMERYSTNLEAIVDERTDLLIQEKRRTEALLYEMLPRSVADQLRKGNKIEAESFDCVTVFFSDIVGFTRMSAMSTPLQTCDLLNDLYTLFDSIIDSYDVYKVETIGDSYMVASGLPIRNGEMHAAEIASMALNLQDAMKKFTIRHLPNEQLLVRIGIHSGPVCAGVVGVKMPRYCLFGDTVNTASRMESTSLPLKIHCSEGFKSVLDKIGGYELVERGTIPIKGKGDMRTYWLVEQSKERTIKNISPTRIRSKKFTDLFPGDSKPRPCEFRPRTAATVGEEYLTSRKGTSSPFRRAYKGKDLNKSASTSCSDPTTCFTDVSMSQQELESRSKILTTAAAAATTTTATATTTSATATNEPKSEQISLQQLVLQSISSIPKTKVESTVSRSESQPFLSEEKSDLELG